jgi:hypothetical protein
LTFGQGISERSSMNATLTYDISNDVPYRAGSSNFEALNFKSQGFDDVTNTNTIAKTLISSSKMT